MKEELKEFYSMTLMLPFRLLCGITITRRKMQLLSCEHSFLCGIAVARGTTAAPQQQSQIVVWYAEIKSFIEV
jgi:hypothetical protein